MSASTMAEPFGGIPSDRPRSKTEAALFSLLALLVFGYVLMRAGMVPLVHDEAASLLWFVGPWEFLPGVAHVDANNHFLSSALGALSTQVFGLSLLALRAGSWIALLVYAVATWRITRVISDEVVRWCAMLALLLCPFVLDQFALFRGYALELAGWLIGLDGVLRYVTGRGTRDLLQGLVGMLVAGSAIVALVPMWAIVLIVCAVRLASGAHRMGVARASIQAASLFVFGVVPCSYASAVALMLREQGALYYGSTEGFVAVTARSLCRYVLGSDHSMVVLALLSLVVCITIVVMIRAYRSRSWFAAVLVAHALLWADVCVRICMAKVLNVNFPEDRAGIHLVPLCILCVAYGLNAAIMNASFFRWASALLLVLPVRSVVTANMDHTLLWPEQSVPERFVEEVLEEQRHAARPLVIGGHHQLALSWPMQAMMMGLQAPSLQVYGFPQGMHDLRIADVRQISAARIGYTVLDSAMGPRLWLLRKEPSLMLHASPGKQVPASASASEFVELQRFDPVMFRDSTWLITTEVVLATAFPDPDLRLVLDVSDSAGNKLIYDATAISAERRTWDKDTVRWARSMAAMPTASSAVLYFYNPRKLPITIGAGAVRCMNVITKRP